MYHTQKSSCYMSLPQINHVRFTTGLHWCGQYNDIVTALSYWWRDYKIFQLSLRVL